MYCAYLESCGNPLCGVPTLLPQFGVIMQWTFSPIRTRIRRVSAYVQCTAGCGPDLVSQVAVAGAFSKGIYDGGAGLVSDCTGVFNWGIHQLEYINEQNLAVVVKRTDYNGSFFEYQTYWLNVVTWIR